MDVILIPGFWLDADSWGTVPEALATAGHRPVPITLPGLDRERHDGERHDGDLHDGDRHGDRLDPASVGLADQVAYVVDRIDRADGPVALVGHSGGGAVAGLAIDARPDRVARVVYVDSWPAPEGGCINDDLPEFDGVIPLPDWAAFDDEDLIDLDDDARRRFIAIARPEPARVATDPARYGDERRRRVPAVVIASSRPAEEYRRYLDGGAPFFAELAAVDDVTWIDLPTGHWPQLTRPRELGEAIVQALV